MKYLAFLFLCFPGLLFGATTVNRYINTACSAGGDGTTSSCSGATRAYATCTEWEAAENTNLVTADQVHVVTAFGTKDNAACNIVGWTTDATRYIVYTVDSGSRHEGIGDLSFYVLDSDANGNELNIQEDYVRVDGLQIELQANGGDAAINVSANAGASDVRISHVLMAYDATATGSNNRGVSASGFLVKVWNSAAWGFDGTNHDGFRYNGGVGDDGLFYNNTAYDCTNGFTIDGGDMTCINCLANAGTDGFAGTFHSNSDWNLSDIASDAPGSNSKNSTTVTFVNAVAFDLHLDAADTGAKDSGTDLSGDSLNPFSDDIDYETRTGTWDIGMDELVSAVAETSLTGDRRRIGFGGGYGTRR